MTWATGPWLGFDSESSGVNVFADRLVTACVAYRSENDSGWTKDWLTNVDGEDIAPEAVAVHGITSEYAHASGQPVIDVAEEVRERLQDAWAVGIPVVAMNAAFDLSLLNAELVRADHRPLSIDGPVLDPLVLDRIADKWRKGKRTLPDLCKHYDVPHTAAAPGEDVEAAAGAHDATADALAALRVLWRIGRKYPDLAALSTQELHERQVEGHAAWAESFESYLRSQGKGDVIDREWPIRRVAVAA
jgi:DNA polymerase-3 subunit epsilon